MGAQIIYCSSSLYQRESGKNHGMICYAGMAVELMKSDESSRNLKTGLEKLYSLFDRSFLSPDPLECVPRKGAFADIEISAFLAATFAYGRADLIVKNVRYILDELGPNPSATLMSGEYRQLFKKFKYRFHKRPDLLWLLDRVKGVCERSGTLENAFTSSGGNHTERLNGFSIAIKGKGCSQARGFLVPSPSSGSACKRMNLFLRWMVRKDSVDLGLWKSVKPSELIIPMDVHVHRIAGRIGLVSKGSANFKKALELTENLKRFDAGDPVRYDFAICSLGKLGYCESKVTPEKCVKCILKSSCREFHPPARK